MNALNELIAALTDALSVDDLAGHLRAWWQVVTGRVIVTDEAK